MRALFRYLLAALTLLQALAVARPGAAACGVFGAGPWFDFADVVFYGQVTGRGAGAAGTLSHFQVLHTLKGSPGTMADVWIETGTRRALSGDPEMTTANAWLVFAKPRPGGGYLTGPCMGTVALQELSKPALEAIQYGELAGRLPAQPIRVDPNAPVAPVDVGGALGSATWWVAGGAVVVVVAGVLLLLRRRRPRSA